MTNHPLSLTLPEARDRAALITVDRYDISVDLRGLLEGDTLLATSTITFRCAQPGASTFVDCVAEVSSATLNGQPVPASAIAEGRIQLSGLAADNVLVVSSAQSDTGSSAGVLRTVDPSDKLVYLWTSFEPDDARRVWACFDQPDLKAPHRFSVSAPDAWTVTSNGAPTSVADLVDGGRLWEFPDTPPLSTYVVVVNAGPFHEIRQERGGYSMGLYCRQSLRAYLERDAADLFEATAAGLAFFGDRFGLPFPQQRYDQVFVPNMGGAMENWGCVTWTDAVLTRSTPTHLQKAWTNNVLLHEMAHMWFGDMVTMRWWDDLWLNEAFASWAAGWAAASATAYTDEWATFLAGEKLSGYEQDMGPATHPIRGDVPDVAQAMANFDRITYCKGQAVLRQLQAYVGEDTFVAGLRAYFAEHAWSNTTLDDLMSAIGSAAGEDLTAWTSAWLDRAGNDTLTLSDGVLVATAPDGGEPRPHRLDIASYRRDGDGLVPVGVTELTTRGARTELPGLPEADLHLLNAGDLTFAAVRPDAASTQVLLDSAGSLPDPVSRALAVTTAWDMVVKGELSVDAFLSAVLDVLGTERSPGVVEPFLELALRACERWLRPEQVATGLASLADVAAELSSVPEHRSAALRTLTSCASTEEHFNLIAGAAADDNELAWRALARRAALGDYDEAGVEALLARDPDPDVAAQALSVRTARPDHDAKAEAWAAVFHEKSVPQGDALARVADCFWQAQQRDVLREWTGRFLDEVEAMPPSGLLSSLGLLGSMFPRFGDQAFIDRAFAIARAPGADPLVRTRLLGGADMLTRIQRAQA